VARILFVNTGDNALIGGFIVTGTAQKRVLVRAIGPPSERHSPIDWRSAQEAEIIATGIPPADNNESAIVATLAANNAGYTAIVRGVNDTTGTGVVEAYDLDQGLVDSKLGNISTRGAVQTGDNVLIAGTIVIGQGPQRVLIRALGPTVPVAGALADPTLELRDSNGAVLMANDNWRSSQEAEIIASGIAPTNDAESAIVATLQGNNAAYTAIVRGANNSTGIALVELYGLPPAGGPTPTPNPGNTAAIFVANGGNNSITKANLDGMGGATLPITDGLLGGPQGSPSTPRPAKSMQPTKAARQSLRPISMGPAR
jgi:hypothetical protein